MRRWSVVLLLPTPALACMNEMVEGQNEIRDIILTAVLFSMSALGAVALIVGFAFAALALSMWLVRGLTAS